MKEIREIIRAFDEAQKVGKQAALATVVHVDGSSYRRPGARMLITDDGRLTGAISGGCLERDALRKALLVMAEQVPRVVTYDTNDADDATLGLGLGCNGIIQVLIEPLSNAGNSNAMKLLKAVTGQRRQFVLVTVFGSGQNNEIQPGTCFLVSEDGSMLGDAPVLNDVLVSEARNTMAKRDSCFKNYLLGRQNLTVFFEFIKPAIRVVVIGAGNDAIPLVKMADILGWETIVADGRADYAKKDRFISACEVIVSRPENILEKISLDDQTVFLLLTHNFHYDLAMIRELLCTSAVYIGCLGPAKKLESMIDELHAEGIVLGETQLSKLYGPVGLDIGAETAEEIALSILAEIKAVLASKTGQSLRANKGAIHSRSMLLIEQVPVNAINDKLE